MSRGKQPGLLLASDQPGEVADMLAAMCEYLTGDGWPGWLAWLDRRECRCGERHFVDSAAIRGNLTRLGDLAGKAARQL